MPKLPLDLVPKRPQVLEREGDSFLIDCHDVHAHDPELYRLLVRYPLEVIPIFDIVIADMAAEKDPTRDLQIQVGCAGREGEARVWCHLLV